MLQPLNNSEEFNLEQAKQMLKDLQKLIAEKQDLRKKEVGDRVIVWDGSGNLDKNTGIKRSGIDKLFKSSEAIVIQTNCNVYSALTEFDKKAGMKPFLLDLLLKFPTGEEIYVGSKFVKRTDKHTV